MEVTENEDGSLTIYWDEDDPIESQLNEWTNDDFIAVLRAACEDWMYDYD